MSILYDWNRKYGKYAIQNLMLYIVVGQFAVFLVNFIYPALNIYNLLSLDRALIFSGQIWRIITFLFIPVNGSIFWIFIALYFYYSIGYALENKWGSFYFNAFYLCGWLLTVIAALITGYGVNMYLNLSLFLAFAIIWPNYEFMVFFVIPVKAKYLAIIDAVLFVAAFVRFNWAVNGSIIASLVMIAVFFGKDLIDKMNRQRGYAETRKNWRNQMNEWNRNQH